MTQTYTQIVKQIESLQRKADAARAKEVAGVVARIKDAISFYKLSAGELGLAAGAGGASAPAPASASAPKPQAAPAAKKSAKSPTAAKKKASKSKFDLTAKFRDASGNEWVGRGPRPLWLRTAIASGKSLSDYAVDGGTPSPATKSAVKAPVATASVTEPKVVKTRKKRRAKKASVAKYKDSASGLTWSGHGRQPGWFVKAVAAGQSPQSMAV